MSLATLAKIPVPAGEPSVIVDGDAGVLGTSGKQALLVMNVALVSYSLMAAWIVGCPWYAMLLYYVAGYCAFYLWHWQCHHIVRWIPFNSECYRIHKEHHYQLYPPTDFFADASNATAQKKKPSPKAGSIADWLAYFNPSGWVSQHEALLYLLMASSVLLSRVLCSASSGTMWAASVGYLVMGVIGNYLHHAFHVRDIWLTRYPWFHELRGLHFVHHLGNARQNYGVLNMSLDRLLGSFKLSMAKPATNQVIPSGGDGIIVNGCAYAVEAKADGTLVASPISTN